MADDDKWWEAAPLADESTTGNAPTSADGAWWEAAPLDNPEPENLEPEPEDNLGDFGPDLALDIGTGLTNIANLAPSALQWATTGGETEESFGGSVNRGMTKASDFLTGLGQSFQESKSDYSKQQNAEEIVKTLPDGSWDISMPNWEQAKTVIAQSVGPGAAIGGLGKSAVGALTRTLGPKLAAKVGPKALNMVGYGASNAAYIAPQTFDSVRREAYSHYIEEGKSHEEAEKLAGEAADKAAKIMLAASAATGSVSGIAAKQTGSLPMRFAKGAGIETAPEAIEEMIQSGATDVGIGRDIDYAAAVESGILAAPGGVQGGMFAAMDGDGVKPTRQKPPAGTDEDGLDIPVEEGFTAPEGAAPAQIEDSTDPYDVLAEIARSNPALTAPAMPVSASGDVAVSQEQLSEMALDQNTIRAIEAKRAKGEVMTEKEVTDLGLDMRTFKADADIRKAKTEKQRKAVLDELIKANKDKPLALPAPRDSNVLSVDPSGQVKPVSETDATNVAVESEARRKTMELLGITPGSMKAADEAEVRAIKQGDANKNPMQILMEVAQLEKQKTDATPPVEKAKLDNQMMAKVELALEKEAEAKKADAVVTKEAAEATKVKADVLAIETQMAELETAFDAPDVEPTKKVELQAQHAKLARDTLNLNGDTKFLTPEVNDLADSAPKPAATANPDLIDPKTLKLKKRKGKGGERLPQSKYGNPALAAMRKLGGVKRGSPLYDELIENVPDKRDGFYRTDKGISDVDTFSFDEYTKDYDSNAERAENDHFVAPKYIIATAIGDKAIQYEPESSLTGYSSTKTDQGAIDDQEAAYRDYAESMGIEQDGRDIQAVMLDIGEREKIGASDIDSSNPFLDTPAEKAQDNDGKVGDNDESGSSRVAGEARSPAGGNEKNPTNSEAREEGEIPSGGKPSGGVREDSGAADSAVSKGVDGEPPRRAVKSTDKTDQGEQAVIPGAEKISDKELAERKMAEKKKSTKEQKSPGEDGGLFDDGARKQGDLLDAPKAKETAAVPEWAAKEIEKEPSRIVVHADGDVALIQGTSVVSGTPVYMGAKKGVGTTRISIDKFTGDAFTKAEKDLLIKKAGQLKDEDSQMREKYPDGVFTGAKGKVLATDSIPSDLAKLAEEMAGLIDLDARIFIFKAGEFVGKVAESRKKYKMYGPHAAAFSGVKDDVHGSARKMGDKDYYIMLDLDAIGNNQDLTVEVLAHEMGHIVEKAAFSSAPKETQKAVRDAYQKWLKKEKPKLAKDFVHLLRAPNSAKSAEDATNATKGNFGRDPETDKLSSYWTSFDEWFADQVTRWAVSSKQPVGVVGKFFKGVADRLNKIFASVDGEKYLPSKEMKEWLDSRTKTNFSDTVPSDKVEIQDKSTPEWAAKEGDKKPKEFKLKFGGGYASNQNGEPAILSHLTYANFDRFDARKSFNANNDMGFHVGSVEQAQGRDSAVGSNREPRMVEVKVKVRNPIRLTEDRMANWQPTKVLTDIRVMLEEAENAGKPYPSGFTEADITAIEDRTLTTKDGTEFYDLQGFEQGEFIKDFLEERGYDGVVYENKVEAAGDSLMVFRPEQIEIQDKSTTDRTKRYRALKKTEKFTAKEGEVKQKIVDIVQKINPNVKVKIVDQLFGEGKALVDSGAANADRQEVAGSYERARDLITVSLNGGNPEGTAFHEVWHSLEPLLQDGEVTILNKQYPATDSMSHEEVVAEAFREWSEKRASSKAPSTVRRIFTKIRNFLRGLGSALRGSGFTTVDSIFEKAAEGKIAERTEKESRDTPSTTTQYSTNIGRPHDPRFSQSETERRYKEGQATIKRFMKRNFHVKGLLNDQMQAAKLMMDGIKNVDELDAKFLAKNLKKDVKEVYGKSYAALTDKTKEELNKYLSGDESAKVPEAIKLRLAHMRAAIDNTSMRLQGAINDSVNVQLDALSPEDRMEVEKFMDSGGKEGKTPPAGIVRDLVRIQTIQKNLGAYLNRSYRAFDDKNWHKRVLADEEIVLNAEAFIAEQNPDLTEQEVRDEVVSIVMAARGKTDTVAMMGGGKIGKKDMSFMKQRKDIPQPIRALLGEYKDPIVNFTRSYTKMSNHIAGQHFLMNMRNQGLGVFFFEKRTGEFTAKVAGDTNDSMNPLNGLYTTEDLATGMADAVAVSSTESWLQHFIAFNSMVKYSKTILSPTTQFRNFYSASKFALANGHFNMRHGMKAFLATKSDLYDNDAEWHGYLRHLVGLGVLHDNPHAQELREAIKDASTAGWFGGKADGVTGKVKDALDVAQAMYRTGDDFWKIIGFENEKALLIKHKGMTEKQADREAARRIRDTYPTYSLVPRGIRGLRKFPLVGTFVSFPWETVRTYKNMVKIIASDYKDGHKELAARKALGLLLASAAEQVIAAASLAAMGLDAEDDEAIRAIAPEWQKNAQLMYLGYNENGMPAYMDMSFLDPYGYLKKPITAIRNGNNEGIDAKVVSAMGELLSPFLGPDIAAQAFGEIAFNKKMGGGTVYSEEAPSWDKTKDVMTHLSKMGPGFMNNMTRIGRASINDVSPSGQPYDLSDELAALMGFRMTTMNVPQALTYKGYAFKSRKSGATALLSKVAGSPMDKSDSDIKSAYGKMVNARNDAYREMMGMIRAAEKLNVQPHEIRHSLGISNVSKADISAMMRGDTPSWEPSGKYLETQEDRAIQASPDAKRKTKIRKDFAHRKSVIRGEVSKTNAANYEEKRKKMQQTPEPVPLGLIKENDPEMYSLMRSVAKPEGKALTLYQKVLEE